MVRLLALALALTTILALWLWLTRDGGQMASNPNGYLQLTVGDATKPAQSYVPGTREGMILRMTMESASAYCEII